MECKTKNVKRKMQNNNPKEKDLKIRTYLYALAIIKFIDTLNKDDFTIQIITKQLIRSATSIGANIIEAQAGSTKRDFTNFFSYALKSSKVRRSFKFRAVVFRFAFLIFHYWSFSLTILFTRFPSAFPFTFGIKTPMIFPISCIDVA